MSNCCTHSKGMLIGAVASILVTASCISFLQTKTGKKMTKDVLRKYRHYMDDIEDFLHNLRDNAELSWEEKVASLTNKARDGMEYVREELEQFTDEEHKDLRKGLLLGGILGCFVGAGGSLLCTCCKGTCTCCKGTCETQTSTGYTEKMASYAKPAKKILEEIAHFLEEPSARRPEARNENSKAFNDVLDFAQAGLQIWKKMR